MQVFGGKQASICGLEKRHVHRKKMIVDGGQLERVVEKLVKRRSDDTVGGDVSGVVSWK